MAGWLLALCRKEKALAQEEKQDVGKKTDESLVLNGAIAQFLILELPCALLHSSDLQER